MVKCYLEKLINREDYDIANFNDQSINEFITEFYRIKESSLTYKQPKKEIANDQYFSFKPTTNQLSSQIDEITRQELGTDDRIEIMNMRQKQVDQKIEFNKLQKLNDVYSKIGNGAMCVQT